MKASMPTRLILTVASTVAILLIFANMTNYLGSAAFAQGNQSQPQQGQQQNQTGGGQAGATLGNASQLPQILGNNTAVLSQNVPVGNENVSTAEKMNKEQTSLDNKTEAKNMTQQQGGGSSGQSNATATTGGGATNQSQQQQQGGGNQSQPQQQGQQQATGGGNATNQSQQQGQNNTNPLSKIPVIGKLFGGK